MNDENEPLVFTVEFVRARLDRARPDLIASIVHQSDAYRERHRPSRNKIRNFGLVLSFIGLGLSLLLLVAVLAGGGPVTWSTIGFVAAFVAAATLFWSLPRLDGQFARFTRATISWRVGRILRPLEAKCPYAIDYALDALGYTAKSDQLGIERRVRFEDYGLAIHAGRFFHFYPKEKSFQPKAVIYFDDDTQRAAIAAAIEAAGLTLVTL